MSVDFADHLRRQLDFARCSAQHFDQGELEEAIRIATSIRVMFHQTNTCTSILTHLGGTNINLLSTRTKPLNHRNPNAVVEMFHSGLAGLGLLRDTNPPRVGYQAVLDKYKDRAIVPFQHWWNGETVYERTRQNPQDNVTIYRRDIVLWAANKDGGAHVDAQVPAAYAYLTSGVGWVSGPNRQPVDYAHYAALRQMAYEVLNSEELLRLAGV